jgi:hypothetical protein
MDTTLRRNWKTIVDAVTLGAETLMRAQEANEGHPQMSELRPDVIDVTMVVTFRGVPTTLSVRPALRFRYPDDPPAPEVVPEGVATAQVVEPAAVVQEPPPAAPAEEPKPAT